MIRLEIYNHLFTYFSQLNLLKPKTARVPRKYTAEEDSPFSSYI